MPTPTDTLRPGLLVSLKVTLSGNVDYQKRIIESERVTEDGSAKEKWETERVIADPAEHAAGRKAQSEARSVIAKACIYTVFGLLCPEAQREELERAIAEARRITREFNATARLSRLGIYIITGRVASDDVEAVKAINAEIRQLMEDMEVGCRNLDVEQIRRAANEARRLGAMLTPEAAARVQVALDAARSAARKIVKAGEEAAGVVDRAAIERLQACRTSFLDLDGEGAAVTVATEGRAVELLSQEDQELGGQQLSLLTPDIEVEV